MGKFVVHQSHMKCWRRCRQQYHYQYVLRLRKKRLGAPLKRGTAVHKMIEDHIEGKDPWKSFEEFKRTNQKLFASEREFYGEIEWEIRVLMEGYFAWWKKDPLIYTSPKGSKKKAEHKFAYDLTPSIVVEGKIDACATDRREQNWLVDHKTHKQIPQGEIKYGDLQSVIYTEAMPALGFPRPDGVLWNYIRWKAPTRPNLLKNGTLSRGNIDTTWTVYKAEILAHGLKPADYQDMKEKLEGKEDDFYVRHHLPINRHMVDRLLEEARWTAREMKRKAGREQSRTIDRHCSWCEYGNLCRAELMGLDSTWIKEHDFETQEHDYDEPEEGEVG